MLDKLINNKCPLRTLQYTGSLLFGCTGFVNGYLNPLNGDKNNKLFTGCIQGAVFTRYPLLFIPHLICLSEN